SNGIWTLTAPQLVGLTITTPDAAVFSLSVTAIATESSTGASASTAGNVVVTVKHARLHERYVAQLYLDVLQRPVDPTGLVFWTGLLDSGATRSQVTAGLLRSGEYYILVVQGEYQRLLHRPADPTGLVIFVRFLGTGGTLEQLQTIIAGSGEYFQTRGGGNRD